MTVSIFICGRRAPRCESCGGKAVDACNYQVKRAGKPEACGKKVCARCRVNVEPVGFCCLAHGRVMGAKA